MSLSPRKKLVAGAAAAMIALVLAAAGLWYLGIRDDSVFRYVIGYQPPAPVSIATALDSLATPTSATGGAPADGSPNAAGTAVAADPVAAAPNGTWTLVQGDTSFAGYRVVETLASFGANTAVGRTTDLGGSLEFDGSAITNVEITADLRTLTSDQAERDEQLHYQALETDAFPGARFVLTAPIVIGALPAEGETMRQTAKGQLTLHGVTREIEAEVEGVLQGGMLVVVGSTQIQFADYGIEQPSSFTVLSTEDHGIMELQLVFARP